MKTFGIYDIKKSPFEDNFIYKQGKVSSVSESEVRSGKKIC